MNIFRDSSFRFASFGMTDLNVKNGAEFADGLCPQTLLPHNNLNLSFRACLHEAVSTKAGKARNLK